MGSEPLHIHTFWMWLIAELIMGDPGKHFTSGVSLFYKLLPEIIDECHSCCLYHKTTTGL
jgi:hypothetical protein